MSKPKKKLKYKPRFSVYQDKLLITHLESQMIEKASQSLLAFTVWTKPDYDINWHHNIMCKHLDDFAEGKIKRLMVFMPPRHGKSELVSRRLPAYLLGKRKDLKIVAASYSDSLAGAMNRDVQRIMESPEYLALFPHAQLGNPSRNVTGAIRNSNQFEIPGQTSLYKSVGIGSGLTGHGADIAIIDDPVKDQQEADSLTYRERVWNWYTSTLYTRLEKNGQVLLTMTRWHEDDLAGRLLHQMKTDPTADQWVIVNYPAIRDDLETPTDPRKIGGPLWPRKYPRKKLESMRHSMGSRVWNALYQQRPAPEGGGLIKRDWLKFYRQLPEDVIKRGDWVQSWDLTFKSTDTSDFVVGQVWARLGASKYLVEQVRARMSFTETIQALRTLTAKYPQIFVKLIEDKANGPAVINALQKEIPGIIAVQVSDTKIARLNAVAPDFEAGNVFIPDPAIAPWIHDYISELVSFPVSANDDQVDATTQALQRYRFQLSGDFSKTLVPKSNKTIAAQTNRGREW